MAIYLELPVYKACYELYLEFVKVRRTLPREERYTIGQELDRVMVEVLVLLQRINATRDKAPLIGRGTVSNSSARSSSRFGPMLRRVRSDAFATICMSSRPGCGRNGLRRSSTARLECCRIMRVIACVRCWWLKADWRISGSYRKIGCASIRMPWIVGFAS